MNRNIVERIRKVVRGACRDLGPDEFAVAEAVFLCPGSIAAAGLRGAAWARDREHECE